MPRHSLVLLVTLLLGACVSQPLVESFDEAPAIAFTPRVTADVGSDAIHLARVSASAEKLAIFVDSTLSNAERMAAVRTLEPVTDAENALLAASIFSDRAAQPELRVKALMLATDSLRHLVSFQQELYASVGDTTEPTEVRHAVARSLAQIHYYISFYPSDENPADEDDFIAAMQGLKADEDDHLRGFGYSSLLRLGDADTIESVNGMLSDAQARALPLGTILDIIVTLVSTEPYFTGLDSVLRAEESIENRAKAARMLGRHDQSTNTLFQFATDPELDIELSLAALSALDAGDSDSFEKAANRILSQKSGLSSQLQVYAVNALGLKRSRIEERYKTSRSADQIDTLIAGLAENSTDSEVKDAAVRYLKATTP